MLYIEGGIGEVSGVLLPIALHAPFSGRLSCTKIAKQVGLCKWSRGVQDVLSFLFYLNYSIYCIFSIFAVK